MSAISDLFDGAGGEAKTLFTWGILVGFITSLIDPYRRDLEYLVNDLNPNVILSPEVLADMVVRGIRTSDNAAAEAHSSGIDKQRFDDLVHGAGEPPALQEVLQWWRRGYLEWGEIGPDKATVANAIATSRVYNYWSDVIKKAQLTPPSPADAIDAVLRNQIDKATGIAMAYFGGLGLSSTATPAGADTTDTERAFQILLDTAGNPPAPGELVEFVRRGLIPLGDTNPATKTPAPDELSLAQGIYEGNSKDKWLPMFAALVRYVPPPRTVTAVYKAGGYTAEQATQLYIENGLTAEDAAAYIAGASGEKLAGTVQLALGVIDTLYYDQAIDNATATTLLEQIGYGPAEAAFELSVQDLKREQTALSSAVSRISTLYISHKITATVARNALASLKIPGAQIDQLIQTWTITASATIKALTQAEIVDAWANSIMTQDQAMGELEGIGYTPFDAWVLLSVKNKAPLPGQPARGPNPVYTPPTAGT